MKRIISAGTFLGALLLLSTASFAAGPINQRQHNQQQRIQQGVRSGAITHQELRHLRQDQRNIQYAKHNARRDGYLSPGEKARIARMQNEANRHIHRAKTNNRHAYCPKPSCKPAPRQVIVKQKVVSRPCPPRVVHVAPQGFLGVTVVQPGWSLAWGANLH